MKLPIYLDYSATTPVDPCRGEDPYLTEFFGNAASRSHAFGWKAEEAVEEARAHVAALINADPKEIVWTSGATEGNNLALKGAANFYKTKGKHIITQKTEHKAVLDTCRELERQGFEAPTSKSNPTASSPEKFEAAIRPTPSSLDHDGEQRDRRDPAGVGDRRDLPKKGVIFHCDAVQGAGASRSTCRSSRPTCSPSPRTRSTARRASARSTAAEARVRIEDPRRRPRARLPLGHPRHAPDRRLRRGGAPGQLEMATDNERMRALRDRLLEGIKDIEEVYVNGDLERRIPHNLNVSFNFVEGESLIMAVKDLAVSSGSACTSASLEPSYVLRALGRSDELAHSSIRFTLGRFTTEEEIDYAAD